MKEKHRGKQINAFPNAKNTKTGAAGLTQPAIVAWVPAERECAYAYCKFKDGSCPGSRQCARRDCPGMPLGSMNEIIARACGAFMRTFGANPAKLVLAFHNAKSSLARHLKMATRRAQQLPPDSYPADGWTFFIVCIERGAFTESFIETASCLFYGLLRANAPVLYGADAALLAEFKFGNSGSAFTKIDNKYRTQIYNYALFLLNNNCDEADDIAQQTFINAYKGLRGFRGDAQLDTWLTRIARNLALTLLRKKNAHEIVPLDDVESGEKKRKRGDEPAPLPPQLCVNPERDFDDENEFNTAVEALQETHPLEIEAAVLGRECKDAAQAAEIAGCALDTFYKRKSRGCALIADWIEKNAAERRRNGMKTTPENIFKSHVRNSQLHASNTMEAGRIGGEPWKRLPVSAPAAPKNAGISQSNTAAACSWAGRQSRRFIPSMPARQTLYGKVRNESAS